MAQHSDSGRDYWRTASSEHLLIKSHAASSGTEKKAQKSRKDASVKSFLRSICYTSGFCGLWDPYTQKGHGHSPVATAGCRVRRRSASLGGRYGALLSGMPGPSFHFFGAFARVP